MTQSLNSAPQKQKFSVAINSKMYQNLIASTLRLLEWTLYLHTGKAHNQQKRLYNNC